MEGKKQKIFHKTFGLMLEDAGFEKDEIIKIFDSLFDASDLCGYFVNNESLVGVLGNIRVKYKDKLNSLILDKIVRYLENVRFGKFDSKENQDE